MPTLLDLLTTLVAVLQWGGMPVYVLVAQAAMRRFIGSQLLLDTILTLLVMAFVIVAPLEVLGLVPLESQVTPYALASLVGGILSVPITRRARVRFAI